MRGSLASLTGVVFVVLVVIGVIVGGEPPDVDEPGTEVIAFYDENEGEQQFAAGLLLWAAVFFLFFVGALRSVLRSAEGARGTLSAVAFGGGVIVAIGLGLFATLNFALSDDPTALDPSAAQALNVLSSDAFGPVAIGTAVLLIASGIAIVRTGALASWLGWIAIPLGIVAVTPIGFVGFIGMAAWVLVASLFLAAAAGGEREGTGAPPG